MNSDIQKAGIRKYKIEECVVFRKTNEPFGGLSNMAPGFPLRVNGVRIGTSEVLYQLCRFPHMPDVQRMLISERSPMTAKMRSKPYRAQSRPDWEKIKVRVMRWCLRVKLAQNWESFERLLESTEDRFIVELSMKDAYWGAKPEDDQVLVGANVLGRLLMELRMHLRGAERESLRCITPPNVPKFLMLGRAIEQIVSPASTREFPASHRSP
jgi:type I restriction enzyme S subunit